MSLASLLDIQDSYLCVLPAPASVARVVAYGLTVDGHTPPTVGCQTRRTECGCEEDAARPGSISRRLLGSYKDVARLPYDVVTEQTRV